MKWQSVLDFIYLHPLLGLGLWFLTLLLSIWSLGIAPILFAGRIKDPSRRRRVFVISGAVIANLAAGFAICTRPSPPLRWGDLIALVFLNAMFFAFYLFARKNVSKANRADRA